MDMRVSYSMLAAWHRGDYDRAIAMIMREPFEPTPQMEAGIKFHRQWEAEGRKTLAMPKVFGGAKFKNPKFELETKRVRRLNDWLTLAGVLDVFDDGTVGKDYKSGAASAISYSNGYQHKFYQVLYTEMERFEYHCHNQYTGENTMSIVHLTQATLESGLEFILTTASDMRAYLENSGIVPPTVA